MNTNPKGELVPEADAIGNKASRGSDEDGSQWHGSLPLYATSSPSSAWMPHAEYIPQPDAVRRHERYDVSWRKSARRRSIRVRIGRSRGTAASPMTRAINSTVCSMRR